MATGLLYNSREQFFDNNGDPLDGGLLFAWETDGSTPKATYKDSAKAVSHTHPILLDDFGRLPADVWLEGSYDISLSPAGDTLNASAIWTLQDATGINALGLVLLNDLTPQLADDLDTNGNNILFDDATGILDDSSNQLLIFQKTASAVNQLEMTNAATGNNPTFSGTGDDTDVGIDFTTKGVGTFNFTGDVDITGALTADVTLTIDASAASPALLVMAEQTINGTNTVTVGPPASVTSSYALTYPAAGPTLNGQVIKVNADGSTSFGSGTVQSAFETTATATSTTTILPADNTTPAIAEGAELFSVSFTPLNASSNLFIEVYIPFASTSTDSAEFVGAVFSDSTVMFAGLSLGHTDVASTESITGPFILSALVAASSTAARTISFRFGPGEAGTAYVMSQNGVGKFNGFFQAHMRIIELLP